MPIDIPKPPEQQKIADCLSSLDDLITAETEQLTALQDHKKGLMQQLFPAEGKTTPNHRFPEFEGKWDEVNVDQKFNLLDGYSFSSKDFTDSEIDSIQVIRITDINNKNKNERKVYISELLANSLGLESEFVSKGEVLLSLTGAAGFNFFIWDAEDALLNQRTLKMEPKLDEDEVLIHLLEPLIHREINEQGSGQNNNLSKESLKEVTFNIPEPLEQRKIASCLTSLGDLISAQSEKTEALKEHKKGLLQQLFPSHE